MKYLTLYIFTLLFLPILTLSQTSAILQTKIQGTESVFEFGEYISLDGDFLAVSEHSHSNKGRIYMYKNVDSKWEKVQVIESPEDKSNFPSSISMSERYLVVGDLRDSNRKGAVYIYENIDDHWKMVDKIFIENISDGAQFGCSVSIENHTLVVGARYDDKIGSAYVFEKSGNEWIFKNKLQPVIPIKNKNWEFGQSILIKDHIIFIGCPGCLNGGIVFALSKPYYLWQRHIKLSANERSIGFGNDIAYSNNRLLVNSRDCAYSIITDGYSSKHQKNIVFEERLNWYGLAIDSSFCAIGDWRYNGESGRVYLYEVKDNNWNFIQKLEASNSKANSFGGNIQIDGNILAVSSIGESAVYVYKIKN